MIPYEVKLCHFVQNQIKNSFAIDFLSVWIYKVVYSYFICQYLK